MSNHVNLATVRDVLAECAALASDLDGVELDETNALNDRSGARRERAERSRSLQLLANRAELVAALARNEYWTARGHTDHLHTTNHTERD